MFNNENKQDNDLEKMEILLWGATGSGKTTLWKSFLHQVNLINDALQHEQRVFKINLAIANDKGEILSGDDAQFAATQTLNYDLIVFKRDCSHQEEFSKSVNTHAHWIGVLDQKGVHTINAVSNPNESADAEQIRKNLQEKTKCVLIVLNKGSNLTAEQFYEHFKKLLTLLTNRKKPCYIAACITKVDLLGDGAENLDPDDLVVLHFGAAVGEKILKDIRTVDEAKLHKINFSAVSATGTYVDADGKRKANITDDKITTGVSAWKPENVEQPFFWLFEQVEKDRLKYTEKGLFYGLIPNSDVSNARIEEHVSYKDLLRSIKW